MQKTATTKANKCKQMPQQMQTNATTNANKCHNKCTQMPQQMQKNATTSDKCKQMQSFASENG